MRVTQSTRSIFLCLLGLLVAATSGLPQDTQYWTSQYGNRARLLGGAVVGSATDLSTVYYNPGLLALVEQPELLLAANVVQATQVKIRDALGQDEDLSSTRVGGAPSLFAGELRLGFLGKHRLAYSFLTRHDLDLRLEARGAVRPDLAGLDPALDLLSVRLGFETRLSDYWAGLTWAVPLSEHLGLGVTQFVAIRSQRTRNTSVLQVRGDSLGGIALSGYDFEYQHWRLLWKVGVGAKFDRWRLGLAVTAPSLGLWGGGSIGLDETVIAADLSQDGSSVSQVVSDFQDDLSADWKSPFSIAGGLSYSRRGGTRLHASAEWFDGVGPFTVMDAGPVATDDPTEVRDADVTEEFGSVLNAGFGVEQRFSENVEGYASFRTDFSAADPDTGASASVTSWDIYHLAAGATFTVGRSDFTLGAVYGFGDAPTAARLTLIPDGEVAEPGVESEDLNRLDARFRRLTFILGFAISFE
ncbi:MAG: hypothetical protein JSU87_16475 [Gemmatimonadota bacterium]|nr:MAG: hypothetical protein JSU87_16475 [Gemmatimonadota bacterium]